MTMLSTDNLLDAAQDIGPLIQEHAAEVERQRRPAKAVLDALTAAGLQRMFTPETLGGLEVDPVTYARAAETIAGFDSVAGWALQAGNHVAWWCSRLPDEGAEEIYANGPDTLIAGAFHPPQPTVEVDGGYQVTGRAPLASNIHDSDWLLLTGMVMDDGRPRMVNEAPVMLQLILRASDVEIVDTWRALGMRGTDSHDVTFDSVHVPAARAFPLDPNPRLGRHYQGPLYRLSGMAIVVAIFTPVTLAIGRKALDAFRELALSKTPMGLSNTLRERTMAQAVFAEAEGMLRAARTLFYDTLAQAWERAKAGEPATLEHNADLMLAGTHAANTAAKVADMMQNTAGASAIYEASAIERCFRDAQTLRNHGLVCKSRYETVGQVYLGVPPEFPFVHL